jgi:phasin family protein
LEIAMKKVTEQFATSHKASLENLEIVANTAFAGIERLASLNLNTARTAIEDGSATIKALLSVKDVPGLVALQQSLAQPTAEKAIAYSRGVYEVVSQSVNELVHLFEGHASELNKNVTTAIDTALKNAPAGSEVAVTAVKSAMSAANSALDQMNRAAKQVTELAEANVAAANAATVELVKKAA